MIDGIHNINEPGINIDTPKTRKMAAQINDYPSVLDDWMRIKLFYFGHHLADHLQLENFDSRSIRADDIRPYMKKYPDIWIELSDRMDRHRNTLLMAMASLTEDATGLDPKKDHELIECAAYDGFIVVAAAAAFDTYRSVQAVIKYSRKTKRSLTDPRNAHDLVDFARGQAERFAALGERMTMQAGEYFKRLM